MFLTSAIFKTKQKRTLKDWWRVNLEKTHNTTTFSRLRFHLNVLNEVLSNTILLDEWKHVHDAILPISRYISSRASNVMVTKAMTLNTLRIARFDINNLSKSLTYNCYSYRYAKFMSLKVNLVWIRFETTVKNQYETKFRVKYLFKQSGIIWLMEKSKFQPSDTQ